MLLVYKSHFELQGPRMPLPPHPSRPGSSNPSAETPAPAAGVIKPMQTSCVWTDDQHPAMLTTRSFPTHVPARPLGGQGMSPCPAQDLHRGRSKSNLQLSKIVGGRVVPRSAHRGWLLGGSDAEKSPHWPWTTTQILF